MASTSLLESSMRSAPSADNATPTSVVAKAASPVTGAGARSGYMLEVGTLITFEILVIVLSTFIIVLVWSRKDLRRNYTNWLVSNACLVVLVGALLHRWAYIIMAAAAAAGTPIKHNGNRKSLSEGLWAGCCHVMWLSHSVMSFNRPASLLLVSIACAVFVYDPHNFAKKVTRGVIVFMITLSWLISAVYGVLRTYAVGWLEVTTPTRYCQRLTGLTSVSGSANEQHLSGAVSVGVEYTVVAGALVVVTVLVLFYSWRLQQKLSGGAATPSQPEGEESETNPALDEERCRQARQAALLTATVNGLYVMMTLPLFVVTMQNYLRHVAPGSAAARVAYSISAAYDVVELILWMLLVPDIAYGVVSVADYCRGVERAERTRLL